MRSAKTSGQVGKLNGVYKGLMDMNESEWAGTGLKLEWMSARTVWVQFREDEG